MYKIYGCSFEAYDIRLVCLALLICSISSFTTAFLMLQVSTSQGMARAGWRLAAAIGTGLAIWTTHFLAVLAFDPGVPQGYVIGTTLLSMALAVALTWLSMALPFRSKSVLGGAVAGAILGLGIFTMHVTGMAALRVPAHLDWNLPLILASAAPALGFGALTVICSQRGRFCRHVLAPLMFVAAVAGCHFVGMSAMSMTPDPTVVLSTHLASRAWLVSALVNISVVLGLLSVAAVTTGMRDRLRGRREQSRLQHFSDIALEGLVICEGETILTNNQSFDDLVGCTKGALTGVSIASLVTDAALLRQAGRSASFKNLLQTAAGDQIPVEITRREIEYAGGFRRIYAVRDLRDQERAAAELEFMANHDPLTRLANRQKFRTRLRHQLGADQAAGSGFALLAVDLDRFKTINDNFGHAIGDALLIQVAERLKVAAGGLGMTARLGGDEFAILLETTEDQYAAIRVAETVVDLLGRPFMIRGNVLVIGASVGLAFSPLDACDAERLEMCADLALYRAKAEGRGAYRLFEAEMDARVQDRRSLEMDLRRAVARQEFELYYQPQIDTRSGKTTGFEALLRWRHPERGFVSPAEFVPIAEEIGLIANIGEWVLRTACREAASWDQPLTLAVNLSPLQCLSTKIIDVVTSALHQSGLAPERLELEITEGVLLQENATTLAILNGFRALGARISLDDFGTGYSSLSYLRSFPFDKIKIDRSFVSVAPMDNESISIIRAIVGLAAGLGMSITAEGVETEEQLACVRREGCNEAQGFLLSRPMEASRIPDYLAAQCSSERLDQVQYG